ncbi:rieske iron-sulfur protein [Deinobacterium chartae]|uniref:Rieske iron-sulfur protein n=1 Tax=Deinobacterium chartae TaxID=521158 RepID=A0A841I1G3_9DEIO|nr:Rieske 2Fe-2S domain-containing protein [Deinobacterium chartae]MBB6098138.1 rieske iron-sulfur protein [Deinobacterium chartae]
MTKIKRTDPEISRRKFITGALITTGAVSGVGMLSVLGTLRPANRITPDKEPPAEGDILVYAEGDKAGQPVKVSDLDESPTRVYPKAGDVVKNGDPNNLLLLMRFPQGELKEPTELDATVQGTVVAYSAICTHLGCQVNYKDSDGTLLCPCHSGNYDPKEGCKVIGGPPPRPLPQLPIKLEGDQIIASGEFLGEPYTG